MQGEAENMVAIFMFVSKHEVTLSYAKAKAKIGHYLAGEKIKHRL